MAKIIRRETRQRGAAGKIVKWAFILFNLLMLILLLKTCSTVGDVVSQTPADGSTDMANARAAGAGLGGALVGGTIMVFWMMGTVILGALTYFTRGPSVIVEETIES